ncbi:MAG: motility associated factor glycosyltransferase family protein [Brevinematia bacterium]
MIKVFKDIAKDGNVVLRIEINDKSFYLSSRYFPLKESEKISENFTAKNLAILVFGLGNPYLIYFLSKKYPDSEVVVVEPIEEIFNTVVSDENLKKFLSSSNIRIKLTKDEEELKAILFEMPYFDYYFNPQYRVALPDFEKWEVAVKDVLRNLEINRNTLKRFGNVWVKNFILSFENVLKARGVKELFCKFRNTSAVVVGAGPSLDKDLELVRELSKNLLVVSVDTSWSYLVSEGIKPDFVITVDPQLKNFVYNILEKDYKDTLFVCDSMYPPIIYKFVPYENIFVFDSPLKFWNVVRMMLGIEKGELMVGGSVICTAIDFANKLGCEYIVLAGVDLSFPNKKIYFKGNYYEVSNFLVSNIFSPYDQWNILSKYPLIETISKNGDKILTDPRMLTFKRWIENYIAIENVKVINISSNGVGIANSLGLDELNILNRFLDRDRIVALKDEIQNLPFVSVDDSWVKKVRTKILDIIYTFNKRGVYGVLEVLERDEFLKSMIELSLQDVLLSEYTEEDFLNSLSEELRYIGRIIRFNF